MKRDNKAALIIAAHPDDETFCYGTAKKLIDRGDTVSILVLSNGRGSISKDTTRAAAKVIGISNIFFGDLKDQEFDIMVETKITEIISDAIQYTNASIVFTHSEKDLNSDHQIVAQCTKVATRPYSSNVEVLYAYEVPSSSEWNFPKTFSPNVFVDITDTIEDKIEAMQHYKEEMREAPHPRSYKMIRVKASLNGATCGVNNAEAFELIRAFL